MTDFLVDEMYPTTTTAELLRDRWAKAKPIPTSAPTGPPDDPAAVHGDRYVAGVTVTDQSPSKAVTCR